MSTIFKNVDWTLDGLVYAIDSGTIGLPDIQRPFVWKPSKVRDLFDSMYKGFPIGYLLFWSNDVDPDARQIGVQGKQKVSSLLIVDGQQRLTSLYAVIKGQPVVRDNFSTQRLRIAFRPRDARFEVATGPIRKDPEYIADISNIWSPEVKIFGFISEFVIRLRANREAKGEDMPGEEEAQIADAIGRLHNLRNYPFTALEIAASVDAEEVADIFVRINSKGVPLKQADFILTLMSVHWDEGRKELEAFSRAARQPKSAVSNHFIEPGPDQLLRVAVALAFHRARLEHVYSVLRGKDMETGQVTASRREEQFAKLGAAQSKVLDLQSWQEFLKVPMLAGYRTASMISSQTALIYSYAMYLIGKHEYGLSVSALRNLLARWFFMVTITARYSASPESQMEKDLTRLRSATDGTGFAITLDTIIAGELTEDFWKITVPNDLATSSARSPTLFGYYAALNLLEARVLFSQMKVAELLDPATKGTRTSLERHHLFPKKFLKTVGFTKVQETNRIGNFALVEWPDNAAIGGRPPAAYFPEMVAEACTSRGISDELLQRMTWWHALPANWTAMEYKQFLASRQKKMGEVVRAGYRALQQRTGAAPDIAIAI